jgi:hypothetical protein
MTTPNLAAQVLINTNTRMAFDLRFGKDVFKLGRDLTYDALEKCLANARGDYVQFELKLTEAHEIHRREQQAVAPPDVDGGLDETSAEDEADALKRDDQGALALTLELSDS